MLWCFFLLLLSSSIVPFSLLRISIWSSSNHIINDHEGKSRWMRPTVVIYYYVLFLINYRSVTVLPVSCTAVLIIAAGADNNNNNDGGSSLGIAPVNYFPLISILPSQGGRAARRIWRRQQKLVDSSYRAWTWTGERLCWKVKAPPRLVWFGLALFPFPFFSFVFFFPALPTLATRLWSWARM